MTNTFLRNDATFAGVAIADISVAAWTTYTPTITAIAGSITSYTINSARFSQISKTVSLALNFTITNIGTGSTGLLATLPATSASGTYAGSGLNTTTGKAVWGVVNLAGSSSSTTLMQMNNYDNTFAGATGQGIVISITYEAA